MPDAPIIQEVIGDRNVVIAKLQITQNLSPAEAEESRNLKLLANKVRHFWIDGVLERSVHQKAFIDLAMETRPEAVEHPWERVLLVPDQSSHIVERHRSIDDIFEEFGRTLLILGEPGAGKTVTLLQLAKGLLRDVEINPINSIPVVFNLSTWTQAHGTFLDWLVDELGAKYLISKRLGRSWLERQRLVLLLDGLDEVRTDQRSGCVEAINAFTEQTGVPGVVVCSRLNDYMTQPVRLKLNAALYLECLNPRQIEDYLAAGGSKLQSLRILLQNDQSLQTLAQSPLMLSVMSLVYQDLPPAALTSEAKATLEDRRRQLFDMYIERMLSRHGKAPQPYSVQQLEEWLSWLARRLVQYYKTVFLIEELQPAWISGCWQRWSYALGSRLAAGWILGVAFALNLWPNEGLVRGFAVGLSEGLAAGGMVGVMDALHLERTGSVTGSAKPPAHWRTPIHIIVLGLLAGTAIWVVEVPLFHLHDNLLQGLSEGFMGGMIFGVIFGLRQRKQTCLSDIRTVEVVNWSWAGACKGSGYGVGCGLIAVLLVGLIKGIIGTISVALTIGGLCAAVGGLVGATLGGLKGLTIAKKTSPNQGIKLSARNAVFVGTLVGVVIELVFAVFFFKSQGLSNAIASGRTWALIVGTSAALWHGGLDTIQHYVLRLVLYFEGHIPRDYAGFLDHASRLAFLQKVGGGYRFLHAALRDHFAEMRKPEGET